MALPDLSALSNLDANNPDHTAIALITPGNNSGVLGLGIVSLNGNTLSVEVAASNLTPDESHSLHIHGFADLAPETLATAAVDADGDGFVETGEGETSAYGTVLAGLLTNGRAIPGLEVSPNFPHADALGHIDFAQTYTLDPADANDAFVLQELSARLDGRILEFHGLNLPAGAGIGTPGEVNGAGGYNAQLPVAQGQLLELPGGLGQLVSAYATEHPDQFLGFAQDALSLLAPYTLSTTGTGPLTPEPANHVDVPQADTFAALLLPSNGSGVLGIAGLQFDEAGGNVHVVLDATGLTPDQEHPAHVHGFANDQPSLLPNFTLDGDHDGFVEDQEGASVIGPVIFGLTADGSITDAEVTANFPRADAAGNLSLDQTYHFNLADPAEALLFSELRERVTGREVQLHGLDVPATEGEATAGEVNGTAGYKINLPVANGILLPVDGGTGSIDTALLHAITDYLMHS